MKLYMTVDFFDDVIPIPWNLERLHQFMELLANVGVKRICWLFHGNLEDGHWTDTGVPWQNHFDETFAAIGNSDLRAGTEAAHQAGMEVFAIYKPFDQALQAMPVREAVKYARVPVVGGSAQPSYIFAAEHREAFMRRRSMEKIPAAKIILKSAKKLKPDHQFRLWASDDNKTYRQTGKTAVPEPDACRVVFDISGEESRFFAIESMSEEPVENRVDSIIEVESPDGRSVQYSLGLQPRKYRVPAQKHHLRHQFDIGGGFATEGFLFDHIPGLPSASNNCQDLRFDLSGNEQNVIGVSLELNESVPGAPEPAEPVAVEHWLKMIGKALDCGVDGVDIRIMNHNSVVDWSQYGFNQPVMDEFIKRYGIDPRKEEFDREKLRRLRGEFYTAFLEKAAALVKGTGKKLSLHVPNGAFGSLDKSTMMEIHWDWRSWLAKGIPDEVTYKILRAPQNTFSPEGNELIKRCKDKNIPLAFCPFIHGLPDLSGYLNDIEHAGAAAFNCYESATLWWAKQDGFEEVKPDVIKILKDHFME